MFEKILIANRGEIACRIIKTARRLGIKTVCVYSDADRDALHVELADEAVYVGPAPASQSYLVIDQIIAACKQTGAQAVHPGYGFLSEREAFAVRLKEEGIVFIGPNAHAIAAMGDKIESKKCANAAGVSTVPGFLGVIENAEHAVEIADSISYPVMIKASAGGGGKGMRVAYSSSEVAEGYARAKSEAASSFGDDRVFIEKFIVDPRHIEIQVLGDKHGNVIYLGERECSIQRRNQKIVEEAPSPLLDEATRFKMGQQAVALAKAVGYDSAGTVEFVAGQDRSFYFLEMNTRLQVEHPVTEMVTGIDLVEEMIRSAAGEPLRYTQHDIELRGWAVESRIYAEDPARNFLPSTGRLVTYREPNADDAPNATLRIDTGVREGDEISIYYDPMVAKMVTHAPTRELAIAAHAQALDAFVIEGIRPNIAFLSGLMRHPRWIAGELSTQFLSDEYKDSFALPKPQGKTALILAAVAVHLDHTLNTRKRLISGQMQDHSRVVFERERVVVLGTDHLNVTLDDQSGLNLSFANAEQHVSVQGCWQASDPVWRGIISIAGAVAVQVKSVLNGFVLTHAGTQIEARVYTRREAELARLMPPPKVVDTGKFVLCPMPGLVKALMVKVGQEIKMGEPLCIIEAMKMENVLRAEKDAVISKINAAEGDSLAVDAVIMEMV